MQTADSMCIHRKQDFNAIALIQSVTETAPGGQTKDGQTRAHCTVSLVGGSTKKEGDKIQLLPVTIFADQTSNEKQPPVLEKLHEALHKKWSSLSPAFEARSQMTKRKTPGAFNPVSLSRFSRHPEMRKGNCSNLS